MSSRPLNSTPPPVTSITVILSPYHVGILNHEVGAGPSRLLEKGLLSKLRDLGIKVSEVEVKDVYHDAEGEIGRSFEVFRRIAVLVTEARNANSFPLVLSGNCGATVGVLAGLAGSECLHELARKKRLGCVWFDAHDDFNIPDTVRSGYFDSMAIAIMAGECWKELRNSIPGFDPMSLEKLVHCGLRDLNDVERRRVTDAGYPVIWGDQPNVDYPESLTEVLERREIETAMIHVDVDVLGATVGQANKFKPAPGGMGGGDLLECLEMLASKTHPASLTVASYDPSFDERGIIAGIAVQSIVAFFKSLMANGVLSPAK